MLPAVLLMTAGLGLGLWPHVSEDAQRAAARFENRHTHAAAVLDERDSMRAPRPTETSSTGVWYGTAAAGAAVAPAGVTLFRRRLSAPLRARLTPAAAPVRALRSLHTGHIGDYAMWFTVGLAAFGGLFILAVR